MLDAVEPDLVLWDSIWRSDPELAIRLDLVGSAAPDTSLTWTLLAPNAALDPTVLKLRCRRLQELINRDLGYSFGQ